MELDFEQLIAESELPGMMADMPSHVERKQLVASLSQLLIEDEFGPSDFEKVKFLNDRLKNQKALAEDAEDRLREFIASQFTITDLLNTKN